MRNPLVSIYFCKRYMMYMLLGILACSGCAPQHDSTQQAVDALLVQGKEQLQRNEWRAARNSFTTILTDYEPAQPQANFGFALAELLTLVDTLDFVLGIVQIDTQEFSPFAADEESRYLVELVMDGIAHFTDSLANIEDALAIATATEGWQFQLDTLPLALGNTAHALDLGGTWDQADAWLLRGFSLIPNALAKLVYATDIDLNYTRAYEYFQQDGFSMQSTAHFVSLVTYLLNDPDYPNFLGIRAGEGPVLIQNAHQDLVLAGHFILQAFATAATETDDQGDNILQFNGQSDAAPASRLLQPGQRCQALHAAEQADSGYPDTRIAFQLWDVELAATSDHPLFLHRFFCLLEKTSDNLSHSAAVPDSQDQLVAFSSDVLPVLDALLARISKVHNYLTFGVPIPETLLENILQDLLGESIALNPGAIFASGGLPDSDWLRSLLPTWDSAPCPATGICPNYFAIELECGPAATQPQTTAVNFVDAITDFADGLPVCHSDWMDQGLFGDHKHFDRELAADGIVGYLPYLGLQTPDFFGLLYLDHAALATALEQGRSDTDKQIAAALRHLDTQEGNYTLADLTGFNAYLAAVSGNDTVSGTLASLGGTE